MGRSARVCHWLACLAAGLLLWLCLSPERAHALVLQDTRPLDHWGQHWQVLEDPSGRWSLAEVSQAGQPWRPQTSPDPNFGYSRSAFWLKVELLNEHVPQHDWLLGLRYPLLDYLDVYVVPTHGAVTHHATGDRRAFGSRPIDDRNFFFAFQLPPGERVTLYLRVQGQGSLQAPLVLTTPTAWQQAIGHEHVLQGMYAGALLAMFVYNVLLYVSLRTRSYLYYVTYLALFGLTQMVFNGMAFQYLWPDLPEWSNRAAPLFMGLSGWILTQFSRDFLALPTHWPTADRVVRATLWIFGGVAVAGLWMDYAIPIRVGTTASILAPFLHLVITAEMLRRGHRQALYFLAAFGGLLVGVTLAAMQAYSLVKASVLTEYGLQIGSVLEITLLSFALAHRLKLAQEANARLQLAHAAELEERVQARTADLDRAMHKLTEANTRLQALTVRDALTGLHNRQFLNERLPDLWRQAQRWHQTLSVLMIDIDHFKQVNDRYGHAAGDEALRLVASTLARHLGRPGDLAVRYGGEEFLVVLPQTNLEGACHIAENLRQSVAHLVCRVGHDLIPLTVSIGVAQAKPSHASHRVEDLLHEADQLLYQAKRSGRNRCAIQGQATPDGVAINPEPPPETGSSAQT
ncbi:MAG: diguanylate cyclase [Burkholderiales bacterium]|nr:diguanylate cyclase [Burkholderiales bacterium]